MQRTDHAVKSSHRRWTYPILPIAALVCFGLFSPAAALATYEQVGTFAGTPGVLKGFEASLWPEEVQLGGVSGMAVNYTGAGGVPRGTRYAATGGIGDLRIARFTPGGAFSESWSFAGALGGAPTSRCGPEGNPAEPVCRSQPVGAPRRTDVDVDQSTGLVYAYQEATAGSQLIHVFSPDGSKLIAEFGEKAESGASTAATPEKIHGSTFGGIAVDGSGDVYLTDENSRESYHRLMEFVPQSAGDYEHYVYAGQGNDLLGGFGEETVLAESPVADAAGHVYAIRELSGQIFKLDPGRPAAPLLCEFKFPKTGVVSIAVNPLGEEVFFYSYKEPGKLHELGAGCDEGKLSEVGAFAFSPKRTYLGGLAFDPGRQLAPDRPAGVLYAGAPDGEGGKTGGGTLVESSLGYEFARPVEAAPGVEAEAVSHVTSSTAELSAEVDPKSSATRYAFQYETEAEFEANPPAERFAGAAEAPPGGAFAGEGTEAVAVAASLAGLQADTAYRYRAVATSHCSAEDPAKVCQGTGEAEGFRTFPSEAPGLPDHRAYELVSPPQKSGGQVFPADPRSGTCNIGVSFAECKPGFSAPRFPMQSAPDGNAIVYEGSPFDSETSALGGNEYMARRDPQTGWRTVNLTPTERSGGGLGGYTAFAADLGEGVLLQFDPQLSPEAPEGYENFYAQATGDPATFTPLLGFEPPDRPASEFGRFELRYVGASADLSRIFFEANDALTAETPFAPEASDGGPEAENLYEWSEGRLALVNVMPGNATSETWPLHKVTPAGAKAVSRDGRRVFFADESGQVYVRIDGEETEEIETEGTPDPGEFLTAAKDGSKVLLRNGHLHYLEGEEATVDLTQGKGGLLGVLGESEDLSHIYFVDTEVLTGEEENGRHQKAREGGDNLYAWTEGEGTRFVATLAATDNAAGTAYSDWSGHNERTAEASPGGRYVAFISHAFLTGYDATGPCEPGGNHANGYVSGPCVEAFLYDSATGRLTCASCNPSGERPLGSTSLPVIFGGRGQPRYLTDEGRLFFDSRDSLTPSDTNDGVEDVYELEPDGVGTCERTGGCLSLISAGTGTADSNFLNADPAAKNVFFTTRDQLTLRDKDESIDLYDAREEGGIPAETEVSRGECQGEACQPSISAPNDPTPGSSTFEGAGNVVEGQHAKKHRKKHSKKKHPGRHAHKRAAKHDRRGAK